MVIDGEITTAVETLIANLSPIQRRDALELLRASIERDGDVYTPPEWHGQVLSDRMNNLSFGPALPLKEAMEHIKRRVNIRRSSS